MRIFDFFPAPGYLQLPAVGFDISDQSLKYVKLRRHKKNIRLVSFGKKSFPPGIIDSGQIKNKDEFVKFLKDFRKEIKNDYLIVALPEEKVFIGAIQLPLMKEEEIRGALELQLEEHIPLQAKETIFDYEIIQNSSPDSKNHFNISFTAAPVTIVESYRDALNEAGFTPLAFETEPHALIRALIRPDEKNSQMILDFGKTRTSFVITRGRRIKLTSTIKIAGESLDLALSKSLSVSLEEGSRLKKEKGLSSHLLPVISAIKDEACRHIDYCKGRINGADEFSKKIEKIVLCGGDANLKGFPEYLSRELHLEVELGNPWINITDFKYYIPEIEFEDSLMYATAIGLALRTI
jgi:type IV pilus assembly protein PilM